MNIAFESTRLKLTLESLASSRAARSMSFDTQDRRIQGLLPFWQRSAHPRLGNIASQSCGGTNIQGLYAFI